jgi:T5SS/PEP-CTERM-associated repeat protein
MNTEYCSLGFAKVMLFVFLLCGFTWPALAVVRTWDNGSTDNNWFAEANWNPDGTPASSDALSIPSGVPYAAANVSTDGGGSIAVDGARTVATFNSNLYVGFSSGTGALNITGGGSVVNALGYVGFNSDSTGMVTVDGSTWTNSAQLTVGYYGSGTLSITHGGSVGNSIGYITDQFGSTGTVTVDGAGSTWTNSSYLYVGLTGSGTLNITHGGGVSNTDGFITYGGSSTGTVTVDGAGSTWTNSGILDVGCYGNGTLLITHGGSVSNATGYLGPYSGSTGTLTVDGSGSTWTNHSLFVGGSNTTAGGAGTLTVQNGGTVNVADMLKIWNTGTVNLLGSQINTHSFIMVPGATFTHNDGILAVDGGSFDPGISNYTINGAAAGDWPNVKLTGGATVSLSGAMVVGNNHNGALEIRSGGHVSNSDGCIGSYGGSTGTVTVDGAGSTWNNDTLFVGGSSSAAGGTGTLTVQNGGTVNVADTLKIWSIGTLNLNGGTVQAAVFDLSVGTFNFNTGTIRDTNDLTVSPGDNLLGVSHTIRFARHLRVDGTTTLADALTIDGGTFSTGALVNPILLQFSSGTFNLTSANLVIGNGGLFGPTTTLTSAKTMGVTNNATIEAAGILDMQGGAFSAGTLTNLGTIQGTGRINAPLTNSSTGKVRSFTGEHLTFSGGGHLNQGQIQLYGGTLEFSGDLTNAAGGLVIGNGNLITGGGTTNNSTMAFSATANVSGDVNNTTTGKIISAGGTTTFFDDVANNGEIHTAQNSFTVFFGSVTGSGSFTGSGTCLLEGDLIAGSAALPEGLMLLRGPASSVVCITGGGELSVGNNLLPCELTVSSITIGTLTIGAGSTVIIQAIPGGSMALNENLTSVPEPSTLALLGIGAISLLACTWRRQKYDVNIGR